MAQVTSGHAGHPPAPHPAHPAPPLEHPAAPPQTIQQKLRQKLLIIDGLLPERC